MNLNYCEHFCTYLLGKRSEILTDHKNIISAIKEQKGNKSYQSRLRLLADRLLTFDYEIRHVPGAILGMADYLSRDPTFEAPPSSVYDELFVIKTRQSFTQPCNSIREDAAMSSGSGDSTFVNSIPAKASASVN